MDRHTGHTIKRKFSNHIQEYSSLYTFTIVLFMMGVIFGAITVNSLSLIQKEDLFQYLNRFFGQVAQSDFAGPHEMFSQSLAHYLKYIGLMWILGLSIIGLPIILILLFLKGVVVGFTVGFLVNQMGWHGLLLSVVSVLPQNIVLVPAFIVVGTVSIAFSLKMVKGQFGKRISEPIFPQFIRYTILMVCIGVMVGIASIFEAYLSPGLMKSVVNLMS
jgi:stage II sporulation protein M